MNENLKFVKSPLNYTGGKFKLLPKIMPLFPDKINTFYDLFGGGFNVGINVTANKIIYNDIDTMVTNILKEFKGKPILEILEKLENIRNKYNLNRENKEGYLKLRKDFNANKNNYYFLMLIFHSFNNQIRFNKKGEFNLPFGGRTFNNNIKDNLYEFIKNIKIKNIEFYNEDYEYIITKSNLNNNDFVYCDPPYSIAFKEYNGIHYWSKQDDIKLMNLLDMLNENNIKFALSNVFECKGNINDELINWSKKYNVTHIKNDYSNCNYIRKNNSKDDEVLITNY